MSTSFRLPALLLALLASTPAHAGTVLLISDPQSSTRQVTLLEHAIAATVRARGDHALVRLDAGDRLPAATQKVLDQAEKLRRGAKDDFEQLELDSALKKYTKALTKLDKVIGSTLDPSPLIDTLAMLAATNLLLGQERKARAILERLVLLQPDYEPNDTIYNPQMMAVFEAIASRARGAPSFDVEVNVDPPGAAVLFDGRLAGIAPVTVSNVRAGRHYLGASLKGFSSSAKAVDIKATGTHRFEFKLTDAPPDTRVQVQASAAVAAIDDNELPPEAETLAKERDATYVLLLGVRGGNFLLVRYGADGAGRFARSTSTDINDVDQAMRAARRLVGSLGGGDDGALAGEAIAARPVDGPPVERSANAPPPRPVDDEDQPPPAISVVDPSNRQTPPAPAATGGYLFSPDGAKEVTLFVAYGGALALAAGGGVFGYLSLSAQQEYTRQETFPSGPSAGETDHSKTTDQIEGAPIADRGRRQALIADLFYAGALVAAITGLCVHLFWDDSAAAASSTGTTSADGWGLSVSPGGLQMRF